MTVLPLRRRTHVERKVLWMLRGPDAAALPPVPRRSRRATAAPAPSPAHMRYFGDLRRIAAEQGFGVHPPETPYISAAELTLLTWLAEAQRVAGSRSGPDNAGLAAAIARCAALLDGMGLRLSPLTLYGARLRGPAPAIGEVVNVRHVGAD